MPRDNAPDDFAIDYLVLPVRRPGYL